jgi:hypothetical protein
VRPPIKSEPLPPYPPTPGPFQLGPRKRETYRMKPRFISFYSTGMGGGGEGEGGGSSVRAVKTNDADLFGNTAFCVHKGRFSTRNGCSIGFGRFSLIFTSSGMGGRGREGVRQYGLLKGTPPTFLETPPFVSIRAVSRPETAVASVLDGFRWFLPLPEWGGEGEGGGSSVRAVKRHSADLFGNIAFGPQRPLLGQKRL